MITYNEMSNLLKEKNITSFGSIDLSRLINKLKKCIDTLDIDPEEGLDVRIQFIDDELYFYFGDSQYDTDHRGNWAYSSISSETEIDQLIDIAVDMLNQLEDDIAINGTYI